MTVADSVREVLATELGIAVGDISGEAEINLLPGMESVKLLKIVSELEEIHGASLDDDVLFAMETVNDLVQALQSPESAGGAPDGVESGR